MPFHSRVGSLEPLISSILYLLSVVLTHVFRLLLSSFLFASVNVGSFCKDGSQPPSYVISCPSTGRLDCTNNFICCFVWVLRQNKSFGEQGSTLGFLDRFIVTKLHCVFYLLQMDWHSFCYRWIGIHSIRTDNESITIDNVNANWWK